MTLIHRTSWNKGKTGLQIPWNKGKRGIYSEASLRRMSEARKGQSLTAEHRRKLSQSSWRRGLRTGVTITCAVCKHPKYREPRAASSPYCSRQCYGVAKAEQMRGSNCHFWKGGITPVYRLIRGLLQYREWRFDVFSRDGFICVLCHGRTEGIEADHFPKPFAQIVTENSIKTIDDALACDVLWDINNGRTLCKPCHRATDTYGYTAAIRALQGTAECVLVKSGRKVENQCYTFHAQET